MLSSLPTAHQPANRTQHEARLFITRSVTPSVVEPGMALLRQRAAKAAAVPPAARSRDVADFVLYSSLMDEALDLLGPHMSSPLATPAGELACGLAAALKAHTLAFDTALHYRGALVLVWALSGVHQRS